MRSPRGTMLTTLWRTTVAVRNAQRLTGTRAKRETLMALMMAALMTRPQGGARCPLDGIRWAATKRPRAAA